jgi:succinyl-CoA synthetase alpha subunit
MGVLIDDQTRVVVQGITGTQGRFDTSSCLRYGTKIVAGVTPGRGGTSFEGIPIFNTVDAAVALTGANASVIYVPSHAVKDAVMEALDAGLKMLVVTAENVPRYDAAIAIASARDAGAWLVGFNTNGLITPTARCKMGGIGGDRPDEVYVRGHIGICSRSGGMSAEIALTLKRCGVGISTCVSLGGDPLTGMRMADVLALFEGDPETSATVVFGEPGSTHEQEVAAAVRAGELRKPVVAIIAGAFQETYATGLSFGHIGAMIRSDADTATSKKYILADAGVTVVSSLEQIPIALSNALAGRSTSPIND